MAWYLHPAVGMAAVVHTVNHSVIGSALKLRPLEGGSFEQPLGWAFVALRAGGENRERRNEHSPHTEPSIARKRVARHEFERHQVKPT